MSEKALKKNASFPININLLALAIIIPALIGSIWLISTLLIAVGLRKTSTQPISLFFLSFFGIYFQAALVGILTTNFLKSAAKNPFVVLLSALTSELLALAGFYCFLKVYYGSWFLPVITLTEPLNDSFLLVSISIIISLFYYWLFIYSAESQSEPLEEKPLEENKPQILKKRTESKTKDFSSKNRKAKPRKKAPKSR